MGSLAHRLEGPIHSLKTLTNHRATASASSQTAVDNSSSVYSDILTSLLLYFFPHPHPSVYYSTGTGTGMDSRVVSEESVNVRIGIVFVEILLDCWCGEYKLAAGVVSVC